jgi:3-methyladenine DNA glycosylase AlkC
MKAENVAKKRCIILFAQEALKVGADWSKPHNEHLHKLFSSPNITR